MMAPYDDFWKHIFHDTLKKIDPIKASIFSMDVSTLPTLGNRNVSGYDGKLITWIGQVWQSTDSAVFRSLRRQIAMVGQLVNKVPGELVLRVQNDLTLVVEYTPISYELLISKYGDIPIDRKSMEIYKWQLIQKYQEGWNDYVNGILDFQSFFLRTDFRNLIYPIGLAVLRHLAKDEPHAFEKLILDLYDENKDLKARVTDFKEGFKNLYFTLEGHGKNALLEERTIATLLTFRYPEKYTFFKDSFYTVLCKGLGLKPEKAGLKIFHYYELVKDFVTNYLPNYPQTIQNNKKLLDSTCYPDPKNMILSQDILYLNLNIGEKPEEETENEPEETSVTLEQFNEPDIEYKKQPLMFPLNQILNGPPGTGKTYYTVDKALQIIAPEFYAENKNNRKALTEKYRSALVKDWSGTNGQIAFVTFHQSMSYEDFVEGIKPDTDDGLKYSVEPGIFKKICKLASTESLVKDNFEEVYNKLLIEIEEAGGLLKLKTPIKGNEFTIYENSKGNLKFHANTDKAYPGVIKKDVISTYLHTGELLDWPSYTKALGEHLKTKYNYTYTTEAIKKNYVLIIDEINRGNISQIFGELITLVETDKRSGNEEMIEIILPYSKTPFSVPANLYIIGTMNTADRSVEALDTALRRRFVFEEIEANPSLLSPFNILQRLWMKYRGINEKDEKLNNWVNEHESLLKLIGIEPKEEYYNFMDNIDYEDIQATSVSIASSEAFTKSVSYTGEGIDLEKLLTTINKRLKTLLTKDHSIGHAWLMDIYSFESLQLCFKNKIIPLLQEFFFNDYIKIGMVLGKPFVASETVREKLFTDFDPEAAGDYEGKINYTLTDPRTISLEEYRAIYN